jgi:type IV pilus assembly protein PilP
MKKISALILIVLFLLPATGCRKQPPPPEKKPAAVKVKPGEAKKDVRTEESAKPAAEEYTYNPSGRRDPFLTLVVPPKAKPLRKKGATPFESYDISEIRLLAIASDRNRYYALIRLPDRKTYTITEGMSLGLQDGKVDKINRDAVVIREYITDYRGVVKPRDTILKLHKGEEE